MSEGVRMPSEDRGAAERGGVDELEGRLETEARAALESLYPHTNKELNQYYLFGTYSDGAGVYDALWVLENGKIVKHIAQINYYV